MIPLLTTPFVVFDTAEGYAEGNSEVEMGRVIKEMGWQRSDLIITTKVCAHGWHPAVQHPLIPPDLHSRSSSVLVERSSTLVVFLAST